MPTAENGDRQDATGPAIGPIHDHAWHKVYDDNDRLIEYRCDLCSEVWHWHMRD
jgi:hypothetical protein